MKEDLISVRTAFKAKEKGFSESVCNYFKIGAISKGVIEEACILSDINFMFKGSALFARPTQALLQKWLREVHNINIDIETLVKDNNIVYSFDLVYVIETLHVKSYKHRYETHEQALEEGLYQALLLIK